MSTSFGSTRPMLGLGPTTHGVLRIGAGLLFMQHGLQKLFGFFGGMGPNGGGVPLVSQFGLAGVIETFGGFLLVIGLFTRPVAAVAAIEMLIAFFQVHFPQGGFPIENRGELPLLFMLIWLFMAGNGAGPFSVDARRMR
jgi:putative oxidoreductase